MATRLTEPVEGRTLPVASGRRNRGEGPSSGPERVARDTEGRPRRQGWGWPDGHDATSMLIPATWGHSDAYRHIVGMRGTHLWPQFVSNKFAAGVLTLFRIISPDGDCLALSETVQDMVEIVRRGRPGRYHVDETSENTLSTGQTFRNWGAVIRFPSGDVSIHNLSEHG